MMSFGRTMAMITPHWKTRFSKKQLRPLRRLCRRADRALRKRRAERLAMLQSIKKDPTSSGFRYLELYTARSLPFAKAPLDA